MSHFWSNVKKAWDTRNEDCLPVVRSLMSAVSIRHSRLQTRESDGSPMVALPPRKEFFVAIRRPSNSSETFISKWLEATAANLLDRLGRPDVRIFAQVLQLRRVASSGALLSLESVEKAQKFLLNKGGQSSNPSGDEFRQLSVRAATLEYKRNSQFSGGILQELQWLQNGTPISSCFFCLKPRARPVYFPCNHSLCVGCCGSIVKSTSAGQEVVKCPACHLEAPVWEIIEVVPPGNPCSKSASTASGTAGIPLDLTKTNTEQANHLLKITEESEAAAVNESETAEVLNDPIDVDSVEASTRHIGADADFQKDTAITHTLESLKSFPSPDVPLPSYFATEFPNLPEALAKHVYACQAHRLTSTKVKAIADTILNARSKSLEAKVAIFSTYAGVLDELEVALNTITFDILMETSGKKRLEVGAEVTELATGRVGKIQYGQNSRCDWDSQYGVLFEGDRRETFLPRAKIAVEPARVKRVPSKLVRKNSGKPSLSVNGSSDRHKKGDHVQSQRPRVPSTDLRVGYSVEVESDALGGGWSTGKITAVYQSDEGEVRYDVKRNGGSDMLGVAPARLEDLGDYNTYRPAVIQTIYSCGASIDEESNGDPYENAIGYVRVDGASGDSEIRGDKLNVSMVWKPRICTLIHFDTLIFALRLNTKPII